MKQFDFQGALDLAFRYLTPRPRSVWEVRQRLRRYAVEPEVIELVITWLVDHDFVDDEAFASFWVDNRESFRPRGKRLLAQELRMRGVSREVLEPRLEGVDEEASAFRAARKKAEALVPLGYPTFASKLGGFLQRRGFSYEVVGAVTRQLWAELSSGSPEGRDASQDESENGED